MSRISQIVSKQKKQARLSEAGMRAAAADAAEKNPVPYQLRKRQPKFSDDVAPLAGTRHERESSRAVIACNDFLRMGAGRAIWKLHNEYLDQVEQGITPPTASRYMLYDWSSDYDWPERAKAYDAGVEELKTMNAQAVIGSGLSLAHERVSRLKILAGMLEEELYSEESLWLKDYKSIGTGRYAKQVEIVRFNASLVDQFRQVLDDIAKEVGGRKQRTELTGAGGEALAVGIYDLGEIRDRIASRLEQFANAEDPSVDLDTA